MKIQVETTQNVYIEYELASLGDRAIAYGIDLLILIAYEVIAWWVLDSLDILTQTTQVVVMMLPFMLYDVLCEVFMNGKSPGKMAKQLKVISLTGREPSISSYLLRWLLRPIDCLGPSLGGGAILSIILTGKGQRVGDMLGNTCVITTVDRVKNVPTLLPSFDKSYEPVYQQAINLTDEEAWLIKDVLLEFQLNKQTKPLTLLASKTADFLQIETEEDPFSFLKVVLKDYHHLSAAEW